MYSVVPVVIGESKGKSSKGVTAMSRAMLAAVLSPPNLGSLAGLLIALVPPVNALFLHGGPLSFLFDAVAFIGKAADVGLMLVLGGNLSYAAGQGALWEQLDAPNALGNALARCVIAPGINTAVVLSACRGTWVAEDKMLLFVILLCGVVPSAMQLGIIFAGAGRDTTVVTMMLFWQHCLAPFSLTVYIALILGVLSGGDLL